MEKEILEILKEMQVSIKSLDEGQKEINQRLDKIESKVDGIVEQTADLTEFKTTVLENLKDLKDVEEVTKVNCYEIAKLKVAK